MKIPPKPEEKKPIDVAFTPAVKAWQTKRGSRSAYARVEAHGGWSKEIDEGLAAFVAAQRSFFFGTASAEGQPYIQHRGGPPGFLKVLGPTQLGFADFRGNRQYISAGNLSENPRAHLFLIDFAERVRVKVWGTARVVEGDPALFERLTVPGYDGVVEQAVLFDVSAWDGNCPQHIPRRFDEDDVARALEARDARIAELERELATLRRTKRK